MFPNFWQGKCSGGARQRAWKRSGLRRTLNATVSKVDNLVWLPSARKRESWSRGPTVDDFCAGTHGCPPKIGDPRLTHRGPRVDTSDRKPTQPTTRHSQRGRTGRERPDVEADADEGGPRLQAPTDRTACVAAPQQQHQPPTPATRRSPQGAAPRHGEGGQSRRRTAAPRHTAGCGPRPGPAPPPSAPPPQPLTTCSLPTTTGRRK